MLDSLKQLDIDATVAINRLSGNPLFDSAMIVVSSAWLWIVVGILAAALLILKRNTAVLTIMLMGLTALSCADYISFEVVKQMVRRERPCWEGHVSWVMHTCGGSYGFTSNHAANAAAVVTMLWLYRTTVTPKLVRVGIFLAALVGFSRVYLGVHYLGDVLGGFVLGAILAVLIKFLFDKSKGKQFLGRISEVLCSHSFGDVSK